MALKKSSRKISVKNPLKTNTTAKKKPATKKSKAKAVPKSTATKKKTKAASGKKGTGVAKKLTKAAKPTSKKKTPAKAAVKKKVVTKKAVSKKKAAPTKKVVKAVSTPKVLAKKKVATQKTKTPVAKKKVQSRPAEKPVMKIAKPSAPKAKLVSKSKEPLLSSTERYNIGGLFACAIERRHDPDWSRLRAVLRHMDLTSQEKDNLIRLSEGFMIPKLFAENLPEPKVNQLLANLVKFGMKQGSYEKYWREEIQQIGFWLGVFPAQFQAIEHQVKR
jgi:hypothetical protein